MEEKKRRGVLKYPHDIVEEILVRVPVKSLMRFRAVSREWRRTLQSKYFVEKHRRYQKSRQARIVTVTKIFKVAKKNERHNLGLENLSFTSTNGVVDSSPYRHISPFRLGRHYKICEPCDGLLCLYNRYRKFELVNPATTSRRILPDPISTVAEEAIGDSFYTLLGIGRENSASPRHKLLWFFECDNRGVNESTRCKVFALDSNAWRYVDPPHCRVDYKQPLIHLDGVLYCFSYCRKNKTDPKVLAFDLHTETFQSFSVTPDIGYPRSCSKLGMCLLNHRLCIFRRDVGYKDLFTIWGLDVNKRSWENMYSIDLSCFPPDFKRRLYVFPVETINNYVILSNAYGTMWALYGSKTHIFLHRHICPDLLKRKYKNAYPHKDFMSFFETLVSVY